MKVLEDGRIVVGEIIPTAKPKEEAEKKDFAPTKKKPTKK